MFPGKYFYVGVILLFVFGVAWVLATGRGFVTDAFAAAIIRSIFVLCAALLARSVMYNSALSIRFEQSIALYRLRTQIITLLEGLFFISIGWMSLRLFNHITMTAGFPYQDSFLIAADRYIFFDWNAYFKLVAETPILVRIFDISYTGLSGLSGLAFMILILSNSIEKARFFIFSFVITAMICTFLGMFFQPKLLFTNCLITRT